MVNVIIELILILHIERKNITLRPNAVPSLFDGLSSYLSNPSSGSRSSPSKRRRLVMERHDHDHKEWLDADLIGSYDALSRSASDHLEDSFPLLLIKPCSDNIRMYGMQHNEDKYSAVIVTFLLRVIDDMTVYVFINGDKLPDKEFSWALTHSNGKQKYWSQLDNILSRYFTGVTYLSGVTTSKMISKSIQQIETSTEVQQHTLNFLSEQLTLLFIHPKGRRYSIDMLICAFAWYHKSPACYLQIKKLLCLPSVRLLCSLSSSLDVGEGNVSIKYLTRKAQCLEPHERVVNIQFDETHIKSKLSYQSGKLIGTADNNDQKPGTRIQYFMISSVLSNNKDVVSLIPVEKMKSQDLCKMTLDVTQAGFTIVSIISDNNIVNRKIFLLLSGTDHLVPYFINPYKTSNKIFMLFDTVHLLKCLRNNWINLKDTAKEFVFPDFSDSNVISKACFAYLVTMYHMEKKSIVKEAYLLTWKALFPNSLERQNVKLALKIFDSTNIAALESLGHKNNGLQNCQYIAEFLKIIFKCWNILNVKSTTKGHRKRLENATPISNL